jgi:hypothetical protein
MTSLMEQFYGKRRKKAGTNLHDSRICAKIAPRRRRVPEDHPALRLTFHVRELLQDVAPWGVFFFSD